MKYRLIAPLLLFFAALSSFGQQQPANPITTQQITLPVFTLNPSPATGAALQLTGNPGPRTLFYWIVSKYLVGNTDPAGPFQITTAPNTLSVSNFTSVIPDLPNDATSYDVLRTNTRTQPSGACNCAVATNVPVSTSTVTDQAEALNAYTVTPANIPALAQTLANEVQSSNVSHLILRQNGLFVADLSAASGAASAGSKTLYVDGGRTDSYTPDGSVLRPFKTIMAAVNQVIANGDNSTTPYRIDIAAGTYTENLILESTSLVQLAFDGHGSAGANSAQGISSGGTNALGVKIVPAAGNALQSTTNNNGLLALSFNGIAFAKSVNLTNPTNNGTFGSQTINFTNCQFSAGSITLNNIDVVSFILSAVTSNVTGGFSITNVNGVGWFQSDLNGNATTVVSNTGVSVPSGFIGTFLQVESWAFNPNTIVLTTTAGPATFVVASTTSFGGSAGSVTVQTGSTLEIGAGTTVAAPVTINVGGTLLNDGGFYAAAVTNNGTLTNSTSTLRIKTLRGSLFQTETNCAVNSVSPAACGSSANGAFVVPTTTTTYTVNTTAVTATSRIFIFPTTDPSNLPSAPTCVAPAFTSFPVQASRVAGTSFTLTLPSTVGTMCLNYWVWN